jgi:hypothetical protein
MPDRISEYMSARIPDLMSKHASYIISVCGDHSKKVTCYRVHIQQYRPWTTLVSINEEGGKTQKEISMCIIVCACVHFASCFNRDWVFQSRTPWSFNPWEVWKFIRSFQLMKYPTWNSAPPQWVFTLGSPLTMVVCKDGSQTWRTYTDTLCQASHVKSGC